MSDTDYDSHWVCFLCGDLDYLLADGLCRQCQPEPARVAEFVEICIRVVSKVEVRFDPRWRIA